MDEGLERMVSALKQTGNYEVLRRFEPPARYTPPDGSASGSMRRQTAPAGLRS